VSGSAFVGDCIRVLRDFLFPFGRKSLEDNVRSAMRASFWLLASLPGGIPAKATSQSLPHRSKIDRELIDQVRQWPRGVKPLSRPQTELSLIGNSHSTYLKKPLSRFLPTTRSYVSSMELAVTARRLFAEN
jgi:hypothetical protein